MFVVFSTVALIDFRLQRHQDSYCWVMAMRISYIQRKPSRGIPQLQWEILPKDTWWHSICSSWFEVRTGWQMTINDLFGKQNEQNYELALNMNTSSYQQQNYQDFLELFQQAQLNLQWAPHLANKESGDSRNKIRSTVSLPKVRWKRTGNETSGHIWWTSHHTTVSFAWAKIHGPFFGVKTPVFCPKKHFCCSIFCFGFLFGNICRSGWCQVVPKLQVTANRATKMTQRVNTVTVNSWFSFHWCHMMSLAAICKNRTSKSSSKPDHPSLII